MGFEIEQFHTVEEAIEIIGTGRVQAYVVIASGFGLMALLLDTMGVSMTIPGSTCELQLDTFRKGLLNSISFVGIALTSHLWGFLADTLGRNKSIRYSLMGSAFFTGLAALVPNFWIIIVLRFLSGMSLSGGSCVLYAYMGEMMPNKVRTKLMVLFGSFIGLSVIVLCGLGWVINHTQPTIYFSDNYILTPWRIQWLVALIPAIAAVFLYYALPESPHFLATIGDNQAAFAALKEIYMRNNKSSAEFPIKAIARKEGALHSGGHKGNLKGMFSSMIKETVTLMKPPYLGPILCCCLVQYSIYTVASGIGMWYPEITNRLSFEGNSTSGPQGLCAIFSGSAKSAEIIGSKSWEECDVQVKDKMFIDNALLGLGYLIANTVIFILQTKMVLRHIVILMLTLSCICGFMLPSFTSEIAVLVCFTVFIMCSGSCVTTINIVTVGLFPTALRGMTLSMTIVLGRIAVIVGVNGLGFLLESDCETTIYAVAGLVTAAALLTMFLMPKQAIGKH